MKEPYYYLPLTEEEHRICLKSLYDERIALQRAGRSTDVLDELIIKISRASVKKLKVVERGGYADAR